MTILITIIVLVALVLLAAAVLPKKFSVIITETIVADKQKVFDYITLIKNQEHYSVWVMKDPNVTMTYTGTDGEVGFKAARVSDDKNVGIWEQEITNIIHDTGYEAILRFEKPMKAVHYSSTMVESLEDGTTKITNKFRWDTPWPMNLMTQFFLAKVRMDMQQNLTNIKNILETT